MDKETSTTVFAFKENPETLEDFIQFYKFFGYDDLSIVRIWAEARHLETELSNMAIQLTASKLESERRKLANADMIIGDFNSFGRMHHHKDYTPAEDTLIDSWISQLALRGRLSEWTENEIREKVPHMLTPQMCYRSLIYYINKVIGVRFSDQEKDEENVLNDLICQKVDEILRDREKEKNKDNIKSEEASTLPLDMENLDIRR